MPRAYLSHSSKDKKHYVEVIAKKLGFVRCVYDNLTFEEGMLSIEEIEKGLDKSDLFVIFLSEPALNSNWVKLELSKAHYLLKRESLERIYPIIIDARITYDDERIPEWLRKNYNLKYISRPSIAARRIEQRLREISWKYHPKIQEKNKIFIGRNDLIRQFEERIDSIDENIPFCIIASGLNRIGRKSYLKYSLRKTGITYESYKPPLIYLDRHESIEDFIHNVYDLGFSNTTDLGNLLTKDIYEKIDVAEVLIKDIHVAKEILFIHDGGCIVTPDSELTTWFQVILKKFKGSDRITLCIASSFRLFKPKIRHLENLFVINVPELSKTERNGLLKRYSEFEELDLTQENLQYFSELLYGYPEQVYYTVDLIKDQGLNYVKKNTYMIVEYNTELVTYVLNEYEGDNKARDFLHFLSSFDFISYNFIFDIVDEEKYYYDLLNQFLSKAICDTLGANKEYVRLNDAIRDYVKRGRIELPGYYTYKLREHLKNFLETYTDEEKDVSDFFYSIKEAIKKGKVIDESYLMPSHFLKTIIDLYNQYSKYDEVIRLASRVLENEKNLDDRIKIEIRFYMCLSLARMRDKHFFDEVDKIKGADHDFLLGFYFRLTGNNTKAIEKLVRAINKRPNFNQAKRELVQVYNNIEEYDTALDLAKSNYENLKNNPYHIQAYLLCLIRLEKSMEKEKIIKELLDNLKKIQTEKAEQMYYTCYAQYLAFWKNEEEKSLIEIDKAIRKFESVPYPKLTKFDIAERFDQIDEMKTILDDLSNVKKNSYLYNMVMARKAVYYAKINKNSEARNIIDCEIRYYPENAKKKLITRIESIS